jgi:hypothetical protein
LASWRFIYLLPKVLVGTKWLATVNLPQGEAEEKMMVKDSITRNQPAESGPLLQEMAKALGLDDTLSPRGRPRR